MIRVAKTRVDNFGPAFMINYCERQVRVPYSIMCEGQTYTLIEYYAFDALYKIGNGQGELHYKIADDIHGFLGDVEEIGFWSRAVAFKVWDYVFYNGGRYVLAS